MTFPNKNSLVFPSKSQWSIPITKIDWIQNDNTNQLNIVSKSIIEGRYSSNGLFYILLNVCWIYLNWNLQLNNGCVTDLGVLVNWYIVSVWIQSILVMCIDHWLFGKNTREFLLGKPPWLDQLAAAKMQLMFLAWISCICFSASKQQKKLNFDRIILQ